MPVIPSGQRTQAIRRALAEAPCTTSEVRALTGLTPKHTCARLRTLEASGEVKRIGHVGRAILWQATARLRAKL